MSQGRAHMHLDFCNEVCLLTTEAAESERARTSALTWAWRRSGGRGKVITFPGAGFHGYPWIPWISKSKSGFGHPSPGFGRPNPGFGVQIQDLDVQIPDLDVQIQDLDVQIQDLEIQILDLDVQILDLDVPILDLNVQIRVWMSKS